MIAEIAIVNGLALTGFGLLAWAAPRLPVWARCWISFPVGSAGYMALASVWVVVTGRLDPGPLLAATVAVGAVSFVAAFLGGDRRIWGHALLLMAAVSLVALLSRVFHMTQLTPDSLRYILFSLNITGPEGLAAVHDPDLLKRQLGYPALHALSGLTDRQYMATIGPLFGVSTLGILGWTLGTAIGDRRRRLLLVVIATAFLLSTNRFLYSWFYINTHSAMTAFLLIAVAGTWCAVRTRTGTWAWPVGISLAATVLLRPDSPLFAAVVLGVIAATSMTWQFRLVVVAPIVGVTTMWYGLVLFPHPHYQSYMSLTSPVAGNMAAIAGGVGLVLLAWAPPFRKLARHIDVVMLAAMVAGFSLLAYRDLEVVAHSAYATVMNFYEGGWLLTWPALTALTVVALFRHRIPHGRIWTVPVMAFGLLYWLLPLLREGAWRVGTGDSGNRILIHFVAVVVGLVVLAADSGRATTREA